MIEELVGRVFVTRDATHRAHWATSSFSQHMALGAFYDGLPDLIDAIVEAYQGLHQKITPQILPGADADDLVEWLATEAEWIEANREMICLGSNAVGNLVDALVDSYLSTVYKLRELK
jgi:hypothetical protein